MIRTVTHEYGRRGGGEGGQGGGTSESHRCFRGSEQRQLTSQAGRGGGRGDKTAMTGQLSVDRERRSLYLQGPSVVLGATGERRKKLLQHEPDAADWLTSTAC